MARTFDPFRDVDQLFTQALRTPASTAMPMDLFREGDNYFVKIDLPGVDPATIDVDLDDSTLTIRAERKPQAGDGVQWLTRERPVGTFARQLTLGKGVAAESIDAEYTDGVLILTIPVAEAAKPRKITVAHKAEEIPGTVEPEA
ncbi:Hsp20/alpha crystallin family protein [Raineyella sp. W15-4]|uniref:Hsp20/alpha crystallin family protein n=1 Tax=Raineyella sp. W15-4 TaxID=3081651 RepID=UPI002954696B|nr:Hsp20/alpha crystallin family protein [Raineyella sp. W15-4]WOQ16328.1 Hsp20/alpha crystallin family protein [Raineyella sp. W15-4]